MPHAPPRSCDLSCLLGVLKPNRIILKYTDASYRVIESIGTEVD
jgi:hypothetical protein